jgi:hypothetical protein
MQGTKRPPDTGFVVDWQLDDDAPVTIDLSTAEAELTLPEDADEPSRRS